MITGNKSHDLDSQQKVSCTYTKIYKISAEIESQQPKLTARKKNINLDINKLLPDIYVTGIDMERLDSTINPTC